MRTHPFSDAIIVLVVSLVATLFQVTRAFNIDLDTALIHRGPPGTYFGFSVSQHKDGRASW